MSAELTQIIYKEEHRAECYPFANVYFNDKLTIFFENSVIIDVVGKSTADKIGVCSWKLRQKQRWNVPKSREITQELLESDYDVLSFTRNTHHHQMLYAAERYHPGFKALMRDLCESAGLEMPDEVNQPVYQNAFICRREIYMDYLTRYLVPIMVSVGRVDLWPRCYADSGYSQLVKKDAIAPEVLQASIGVPYYPMIPFLLERLFSIYCHNNKIKVSYI